MKIIVKTRKFLVLLVVALLSVGLVNGEILSVSGATCSSSSEAVNLVEIQEESVLEAISEEVFELVATEELEAIEVSEEISSSSKEEGDVLSTSSATEIVPVLEFIEIEVPISYKVPTSIVRSSTFEALRIIGQWQMLDMKTEEGYVGLDDSIDSGAQIMPSGQFNIDKQFAVCALVADAQNEPSSVSATISYPEKPAYAEDNNLRGCGVEQGQVTLSALELSVANNLVCNQLRVNNNNLLTWREDNLENYSYSYDQICGQEGFLAIEKVSLYCAEVALAYDDPAGDYLLKVTAGSVSGETDTMENYLKYLELTNYEKDFEDIHYGMVVQNEIKYLSGDLKWGDLSAPTVRNTGNTRLQLKIRQNDFGFGKSVDIWNVANKAKIGDKSEYVDYFPEESAIVDDILGLGSMMNIDLAITIANFPDEEDQTFFSGEMTLSAQRVGGLSCLP